MSSEYVRTQIKDFLEANSDEDVIDLTGVFDEIKDLLSEAGIQPSAPWLGIQFVGDDEIPVALAATNDQGKYRETGGIFFHVVSEAKIGVGDSMLTRGEALRNLFRGQRIGGILIESVKPMNFESGATLQFEGGYMAGTFFVEYQRDLDL